MDGPGLAITHPSEARHDRHDSYKKLDGLSAQLGAFMSRLATLADRPRSPAGTTPEDRADRQRAVAFASPERSELGINMK